MLEHGGNLRRAAEAYGIPVGEWLDLSTGINPRGWPVPPLPVESWARLPEAEDGLEAAARRYYGVDSLLPVAGSQAAIQALPRLRRPCRVGLLKTSYAEHQQAWMRAGHRVVLLAGEAEIDLRLSQLDVLVLVRPNNPTGERFALERLLTWQRRLAQCGGWLLADEAFMDATPEQSLLPHLSPGLIVLRSLGKFFGLAGARVGFVCAEADLLSQLADYLGPWSVSGPARRVAAAALDDRQWQAQARGDLQQQGARLHELLSAHGLVPEGGCELFRWMRNRQAAMLQDALARHGILIRRFTHPSSLRFGLPGGEHDWQRLRDALEACT